MHFMTSVNWTTVEWLLLAYAVFGIIFILYSLYQVVTTPTYTVHISENVVVSKKCYNQFSDSINKMAEHFNCQILAGESGDDMMLVISGIRQDVEKLQNYIVLLEMYSEK